MYKSTALITLLATFGVALTYGSYVGGYDRQPHGYGQWGYWGEWSDCTKTCGGGSQTRTRECKQPQYQYYGEYKQCYGVSSETRYCNTQPCPVDGVWSEWGTFSDCSKTCGGGEKTRYRTCSNPAPAYGGADCDGDASETDVCNEQGCPVNGAWSEWGEFGDCSVDCGYGEKTRTRSCTKPAPANGGADCYGSDTDVTYCFIYKCPVDGAWNKWSEWTSCSATCGTGSRVRSRTCTYPAPANGGDDCEGDSSEHESCKNYNECYHHGYDYKRPHNTYKRYNDYNTYRGYNAYSRYGSHNDNNNY